uniref:Uncharacterized protein n=1 Tax=Histophilus somni (strain 129Pt) TaxID=205914 RepID=Q0I3U7_HISS1
MFNRINLAIFLYLGKENLSSKNIYAIRIANKEKVRSIFSFFHHYIIIAQSSRQYLNRSKNVKSV